MKYIRLASDIHLDCDVKRFHSTRMYDPNEKTEWGEMSLLWFPEPMEGDDDTTFVLAGDMWYDRYFLTRLFPDGESWLKKLSKMFKYVVIVLGNHDYWDCNLTYEHDQARQEIYQQDITNVHLLEKSLVVLDQVKFVGGTLWTDYHRNEPLVMNMAVHEMKDYNYISQGTMSVKARPYMMYEVFQNTKKFIFKNAVKDNDDQKLVVVTHMAPSYESVHDDFRTWDRQIMNHCYYSDLDRRMKDEGKAIDYWFHGHMHRFKKYKLVNSTVICNPRGYSVYNEPTNFQPKLRIEL